LTVSKVDRSPSLSPYQNNKYSYKKPKKYVNENKVDKSPVLANKKIL
jgi:hypothetical protein